MYRVSLAAIFLTGSLAFASSPPAGAPPPSPPLIFEPNRGQAPAQAKWMGHGPGYLLTLSRDGLAMRMRVPAASPSGHSAKTADKYDTIQMKLDGGRPWDDLTGLEPTGGSSDYYIGKDRKSWHAGIPHYAKVRESGVYDGIDLVFHNSGSNLEYDFVVKPGADPNQIKLAFDGAEQMRLDANSGDLVLTGANGSELRENRPRIYQQIGDRRVEVAGGYRLLADGQAGFSLAAYDHAKPLIIDPLSVLLTYQLGQYAGKSAVGVAVDEIGNMYVTGPDVNYSEDVYISLLTPQGSVLKSTYLGGSGSDFPTGIAVDSSGVYVCGSTASADFPLALGIKQDSSADLFIAKMDALLEPQYVKTVGTPLNDYAAGMALNPETHDVYMVGVMNGGDFPQVGPVPARPKDYGPGVVIHVDANGSLVNSLWIGPQTLSAIAVDHLGGVWVTGHTCNPDSLIITVPNTVFTAGCPGFVSRYTSDFSALTASRPFAVGTAITTDALGNAYVAGTGIGTNTPLVAKLDIFGNQLAKYDFEGANGPATFNAIALNSAGEVYVAGNTSASIFPGVAQPLNPNPVPPNYTFGFRAKISADLKQLEYTAIRGSNVTGLALRETQPWTTSQPLLYTVTNTYSQGGPPTSSATIPELSEWSEDPGPAQAYEGLLMKDSTSPKVYFICSGQRKFIPDESTFEALGFDWSKLIVDNSVDSIPDGTPYPSLPTGKTFRDPLDPRVYLLQNGVRRWIPDEATFVNMGLSWNNVALLPYTQLHEIPLGPPMPAME